MPTSLQSSTARTIVVGIDTHKDVHVAVALDHLGRRLAELHVPTTTAGYSSLEHWTAKLGIVDAFGIEGTGSYGAGLMRFLRQRNYRLIEVLVLNQEGTPRSSPRPRSTTSLLAC